MGFFFFQNNYKSQTILFVSQGFETILVSNKSSVENSISLCHTRFPSAILQSKIEFSTLDLLDIKIVSKPWLTNKIVWGIWLFWKKNLSSVPLLFFFSVASPLLSPMLPSLRILASPSLSSFLPCLAEPCLAFLPFSHSLGFALGYGGSGCGRGSRRFMGLCFGWFWNGSQWLKFCGFLFLQWWWLAMAGCWLLGSVAEVLLLLLFFFLLFIYLLFFLWLQVVVIFVKSWWLKFCCCF